MWEALKRWAKADSRHTRPAIPSLDELNNWSIKSMLVYWDYFENYEKTLKEQTEATTDSLRGRGWCSCSALFSIIEACISIGNRNYLPLSVWKSNADLHLEFWMRASSTATLPGRIWKAELHTVRFSCFLSLLGRNVQRIGGYLIGHKAIRYTPLVYQEILQSQGLETYLQRTILLRILISYLFVMLSLVLYSLIRLLYLPRLPLSPR